MTGPGELSSNFQLQARTKELLKDAPFVEDDVHVSTLFLNFESIHLLNPSFPNIENHQLTAPIFEAQADDRASKLSKMALKTVGLVSRNKPDTPLISYSPKFVTRQRALMGTPKDGDPWALLRISEISYDGTITVDDQEFKFDSEQTVILASSNWLNTDGRQISSGITYKYVPHRNYITSDPSQEMARMLPYVSTGASPQDNLMSIIEAASRI